MEKEEKEWKRKEETKIFYKKFSDVREEFAFFNFIQKNFKKEKNKKFGQK